MNKVIYAVFLLLATFALIYVVLTFNAFWGYLSGDSPISKTEWSVLQEIEHKNRNKVIRERVIFERIHGNNAEYLVAGIAKEKAGPRVWVLLNPQAKPLFKQLPESSHYILSKDDIDRFEGLDINPVVLFELNKHLLPD